MCLNLTRSLAQRCHNIQQENVNKINAELHHKDIESFSIYVG